MLIYLRNFLPKHLTYETLFNNNPLISIPTVSIYPYVNTTAFEIVKSKENSALCLPCLICECQVNMDKMRYHIGLHIIKGEAEKSVCGACGTKCGNQISMKQGSKKSIVKAYSSCIYFKSFNFGDRIVDYRSGNPCTNRPVTCEACKPHTAVFWSYYLQDHYKQSHPGHV